MEFLDQIIKLYPAELQNYQFLDSYGLGLYKQGKYNEALKFLEKSWELRTPTWNQNIFLHLEAAKKAVPVKRIIELPVQICESQQSS